MSTVGIFWNSCRSGMCRARLVISRLRVPHSGSEPKAVGAGTSPNRRARTIVFDKVRISSSGDTPFLPNAVVDKMRLREENNRQKKGGKKTATFKPLLLGITKAAIQSESFIAAASFQETTKVLTDAALAGRRDELVGLKENVIVGHMVPAGTGFKKYLGMKVQRDEPEQPEPAPEAVVPA